VILRPEFTTQMAARLLSGASINLINFNLLQDHNLIPQLNDPAPYTALDQLTA